MTLLSLINHLLLIVILTLSLTVGTGVPMCFGTAVPIVLNGTFIVNSHCKSAHKDRYFVFTSWIQVDVL